MLPEPGRGPFSLHCRKPLRAGGEQTWGQGHHYDNADTFVDWLVRKGELAREPAVDEEMGTYEDDVVSAADTLLLGRVTYQSFAGSWPYVPDNPAAQPGEKEYARKLNAMRKIVFSKTLHTVEWNNSSLVKEVLPEDITKLKQGPGRDMLIYGSASIVRTLTNHGLIDEYQLLVHLLPG